VRAARISSIIVGIIAIVIGILAKGQNVAHLVALAFAVAASSNLPAVLLTLYWKGCNTKGIVLGMLVGATTAIGLVMVSPNMTYPNAVRATNQPIVEAAPAKIAAAEAQLAAATDEASRSAAEKALAGAQAALAGAQAKIDSVAGQTTSIVGLEAPLITLKNPGIISIPLGFLFVLIGSLLGREKRSDEMWEELYVRQNTGIHAEGASAH
jgi:cation/acetate symporter